MADRSRVLIQTAEYDHTLQSVVEKAFESSAIDVTGKKVLVKPNLLSARAPEKGVTTHPAVVAAVIKSLEKRKAGEIIVGDNSGMSGYGENDAVAAKTGVLAASEKYFKNLGLAGVRVPLHNPYVGEVAISGEILDCEVLISLPKFKTHSLTTITCAIKNSYGFLLGAEKARLHRAAPGRKAFASAVVDVWALRRPDLVICDAVTAMQGNGPSSRDVFHYGKVISATDSVALDSVVGRLMGVDWQEVPTTAEAARRGLGVAKYSQIDVEGELKTIEGFKLPSTFRRGSVFNLLARVAGALVVSHPHPDTNICIRCGLCRDHCPEEAITLSPYPRISQKKCIRCYCCLEFCPYDAMKLSKRVMFIRNFGRRTGN